MFRPDMCDGARFPAVQTAGERAHGEWLRLVGLMHGKGPDVSRHFADFVLGKVDVR